MSTSRFTVAPSGTFATEIGNSVRNSRPTGAKSRATARVFTATACVSPKSVSSYGTTVARTAEADCRIVAATTGVGAVQTAAASDPIPGADGGMNVSAARY